jgi:hypothetical protein
MSWQPCSEISISPKVSLSRLLNCPAHSHLNQLQTPCARLLPSLKNESQPRTLQTVSTSSLSATQAVIHRKFLSFAPQLCVLTGAILDPTQDFTLRIAQPLQEHPGMATVTPIVMDPQRLNPSTTTMDTRRFSPSTTITDARSLNVNPSTIVLVARRLNLGTIVLTTPTTSANRLSSIRQFLFPLMSI